MSYEYAPLVYITFIINIFWEIRVKNISSENKKACIKIDTSDGFKNIRTQKRGLSVKRILLHNSY